MMQRILSNRKLTLGNNEVGFCERQDAPEILSNSWEEVLQHLELDDSAERCNEGKKMQWRYENHRRSWEELQTHNVAFPNDRALYGGHEAHHRESSDI